MKPELSKKAATYYYPGKEISPMQPLTLKQTLEASPITICPEIFDCVSAKAVELCGFGAVLLSSTEFALSLQGNPDLGFLTLDDLTRASYYISRTTPLPLIIDADDCFGSPLHVFNACQRMSQAGAQGILVIDATCEGGPVLSLEDAEARFRAAKKGMEGTDCLLIARCDVYPQDDIEEVIRRCNIYHDLGADLTLAVRINSIKDRALREKVVDRIGREVKGWKMYPDLGSVDGTPDIDIDAIAPLGYKLVGVHYLMKAAMKAMLDYGHHIYNDRSNIYDNKALEPKVPFVGASQFFGMDDGYWPDLEKEFIQDPDKCILQKEKKSLDEAIAKRYPDFKLGK